MRREQPPISRPGKPPFEGDTNYEHPAYGQIGAYRSSWNGGGTTLYGTDFKHRNTIRITVQESELTRGLHHDRHHAKRRIVEVELSEAQWATFVSSLNIGEGVPCTIRSVEGKEMPGIPYRQQVTEFESEIGEDARKMAKRVEDAIAAVEGEIGSSLSNKRRDAILAHLRSLHQDLRANLPYVVKTFGEHIEETVEKAKIEVNAYATNLIQRAGLQALGAVPPLALPGRVEAVEALGEGQEGDGPLRMPDGQDGAPTGVEER